MEYLFRKIKNSVYRFLLVLALLFGFTGFSINTLIKQSIAINNQVECLEDAIILLQKKEIERLEKDLEKCKDTKEVDCVYRETL